MVTATPSGKSKFVKRVLKCHELLCPVFSCMRSSVKLAGIRCLFFSVRKLSFKYLHKHRVHTWLTYSASHVYVISNRRLTPAAAESLYLEKARLLPDYGVDMHTVKVSIAVMSTE